MRHRSNGSAAAGEVGENAACRLMLSTLIILPMPVPLETLRLAAALAHTVPDVDLSIATEAGPTITIGRHPSADLDPCRFRQAVAAGTFPGATDCSQWISDLEIGGSLTPIGGVTYRFRGDGAVRVFATLLSHDATADLVAERATELDLPDDAEARVLADTMLGLSVVRLRVPGVPPWTLDRVAGSVAGTCLVAEVIAASRVDLRRSSEQG